MYLKTLYHFYTPLFRSGRSPRELAHFIADASKFRQASMLAAENARNKLKTYSEISQSGEKGKSDFFDLLSKILLVQIVDNQTIFSISKIEKLILNLISTNLIESSCTIIIFQQTITVIIQIIIWEIPLLISCNNSWNWKTLVHVMPANLP